MWHLGADDPGQLRDLLEGQLSPWPDTGVMLRSGDPEESFAQVGLDPAAMRQQHRKIILRVEMVFRRRDPLEGKGLVHIHFGADTPLILKGHFEDGTDMPGGGCRLVMQMGQHRAGRHVGPPFLGVSQAKAIMCYRVAVSRMWFPDGNGVAEPALTGSCDSVPNGGLEYRVAMLIGRCRRGDKHGRHQQAESKNLPLQA